MLKYGPPTPYNHCTARSAVVPGVPDAQGAGHRVTLTWAPPGPVRGLVPHLAPAPWHNTKEHHEDSRGLYLHRTLWNTGPFGASSCIIRTSPLITR